MTTWESFSYRIDPTVREVELACAEREGWHLRELEIAHELRREARRHAGSVTTFRERTFAGLMRLAQAATSWLL